MGGKDDTGGILGAHVSEESEARKILENGLIESYIDFVYLTKGGIPVAVMPLDMAEDQIGQYRVRIRI